MSSKTWTEGDVDDGTKLLLFVLFKILASYNQGLLHIDALTESFLVDSEHSEDYFTILFCTPAKQ